MRQLGIPDEMIGGVTQRLGGRSGAFNPNNLHGGGVFGKNIEVDAGVLSDQLFGPGVRLRDRIDAVIAHEFEEALSPARNVFSRHLDSLRKAPNTNLPISDNARSLLRTKLSVEGQ